MPRLTLQQRITGKVARLAQSGFKVGIAHLWNQTPAWASDYEEAKAKPFPPQHLAAIEIFSLFFTSPQKAWVHLAAEMQAGKTGVVTCLIRLMLNSTNFARVNINSEDIFVITGMSDTAWVNQTRNRMPTAETRGNVYHNNDLHKIVQKLSRKKDRDGLLKNVLIVLDESHHASKINNRPYREVFDKISAMCPVDSWSENNIRILTISATDPACEIATPNVVRLLTNEYYQSVQKLNNAARLYDAYSLKDETGVSALVKFINATFGENANLHHVIRLQKNGADSLKEMLSRLMPGCRVISWDSTRTRSSSSSAASASTKSDDINAILDEEPLVPTFILIKNMFYAAKTVHDTHIGVFFERITSTSKDDTILQSLLGRACGYGKSTRTQIFTSLQTVTNYINVWTGLVKKYKLGSSITIPHDVEHSFKNKQPMAGIAHRSAAAGTTLGITLTRALPTSSTRAGNIPALPTLAPRVAANTDDFESEWSPWFTTEDEMHDWAKKKGGNKKTHKKNDDGFYLCSATEGRNVLRKESIDALRAGKKTSSLPNDMAVDRSICRRYVAYVNTTDKDSVCFCVHWIKRIR